MPEGVQRERNGLAAKSCFQTRFELVDAVRGVLANALQDIDQTVVGVDAV